MSKREKIGASRHATPSAVLFLIASVAATADVQPAAISQAPQPAHREASPATERIDPPVGSLHYERDLRLNIEQPVVGRVIARDHADGAARLQILARRPNDLFGWSILPVADADLDGIADVAISAPNAELGHGRYGEVSLHSGADGSLIWSAWSVTGETFGVGLAVPDEAGLETDRQAILVRTHSGAAGREGVYGWQLLDIVDGSLLNIGFESDLPGNPDWHTPPSADDLSLRADPIADLDADGDVDIDDLNLMLSNWAGQGDNLPGADINRDGVIDAADLQALLASFGSNPDVQGQLGCTAIYGFNCCFCWIPDCVGGIIVGHCGPGALDDNVPPQAPPGIPNHCRGDDDQDGIADWRDCDSDCYVGSVEFDCGCRDDDGDGEKNQNDCDSDCYKGNPADCDCDMDTDGDGVNEQDEDDDCDGIPNRNDCDSACFDGNPNTAPCCQDDDEDGVKNQDDPDSGCYVEPAVNLTIDSNNDGDINDDDDEIEDEAPGRIVVVNDDDDDTNAVPDNEQEDGIFMDDELVRVKVSAPEGPGNWAVTFAETIRVYSDEDRSSPLEAGEVHPLPAPTSLWIEGLSPSAASGDSSVGIWAAWDTDDDESPDCSATDEVRFTRLSLSLDGPGDISVDEGDAYIGAILSLTDASTINDTAEIVDSLEATLRLYRNGSSTGSVSSPIEVAGCADGFGIGTNPGATLEGEVEFLGATRRTQVFHAIAGEPYEILSLGLDGPQVNDGIAVFSIGIVIRDQFGNPVEDGTPVDWTIEQATGELDELTSLETIAAGFTYAVIRLSDVSSPDPLIIRATSGVAEYETTVSVHGADISSLTPSSGSLDIASQESCIVTLVSSNAGDGAAVEWLVSNATIAGAGENPRSATTEISGGTTSIMITAAPGLSQPNSCEIIANLAGSNLRTTIQIVDTRALTLSMSRPVIAGNIAQDTNILVQPGIYTILPGSPPSSPEVPTRQNVVCPAESILTLRGKPDTVYDVGLVNPDDFQFIEFVGGGPIPNDPTAFRYVTDQSGMAHILIRSTGMFTAPDGEWAHNVNIDAKQMGASPGTRIVITIPVTLSEIYAPIISGLGSFLGLTDPTTGPEIAANVAGGILIVGDVGSIVKNLLRFAGATEGDPNWTEVMLSGAGLLTELFVGGGEVLDVPISILRAIVAAIGNNPATRALVALFKRAVLHGDGVDEFAALMRGFTAAGTDVNRLKEVIDSPEIATRLARAADGLGDDAAAGLFQRLDDLVAAGKTADAKLVASLIGSPTLSPQVLSAIKLLPPGQQSDLWAAIAYVGRRLDQATNRIDGRVIVDILNNRHLIGGAYTHADLLGDMAKVLEKAPNVSDGFQTLAKRLRSHNLSNAKGALYELTVASKLIDEGFEGAQVVKVRVIAKYAKTTAGRTDIDLAVELTGGRRVIIQGKATSLSASDADGIRLWIRKAKAWAKKIQWMNAEIYYAVPSGYTVSTTAREAIVHSGAKLIEPSINLPF